MTTRIAAPTLGVIVGLLAYGTYATADALVKFLGTSLNVFEIGLFTAIFAFIPGMLAKPRTERFRDAFRFRRPVLMHAMGMTRMVAGLLATYAFVSIPLAEVYSIVFLIPMFTAILSVIVLKEKVTVTRIVVMLLSFAGVLIVVRPGFRELQLGHLATLGCAIAAAASVIITRLIAHEEQKFSVFTIPLAYSLAANIAGLVFLGFGGLTPVAFLWLVVGGVVGGIGYLFQMKALELAPANVVAPTQYTQIAWALFFGALFFNEVPDAVGLVGLAVVVVAGIANIAADGARTRIAGRWAEYRAARAAKGPSGYQGPGPDPV